MHPGATQLLQEIHHHLALAQAPDHHREVSDVGPVSSQPHQVAGDALQLYCHQANVLGSLGHLNLEEVFGGVDVGVRPRVGASVAESVTVSRNLSKVTRLTDFLHTSVNIAEIRFCIDNGLAVDLDLEGPEAVRHGVLRAH